MTTGVALWDAFVARGVARAGALAAELGALPAGLPLVPEDRARLGRAGDAAFAIGLEALGVGAEPVGRLAIAIEHVVGGLLDGTVAFEGVPFLGSAAETLRQAFAMLANPDRSGARVEGLPLEAARFELESLLPRTGALPPSAVAPDVPLSSLIRSPGSNDNASANANAAVPADLFRWQPTVDDDMLELFFAEVADRVEALAGKLVEIEGRPDDGELIRDIFRDLHTLKGSSAMVGLQPMNALAHAAEDLVGQLRDGTRRADGPVIDALLGAIDGLRALAARASAREPIPALSGPIVERLRDPAVRAPAPIAAVAPRADEPDPARAADRGRQTIRVDFDKLDRLLNLVGELVLGRDGLRGSIGALSALGGELAADRRLSRRLEVLARPRGRAPGAERPGQADGIGALGEELGRVERVLGDLATELEHSSSRLDSVSGELRDAVMKLRMVPVGGTLKKHHRTVRDLAQALGKQVRLIVRGEDTELDKLLVEALDEPLMHLVRNAVDHGLESAAARAAAGKPTEGTITLAASHRGNRVEVRIVDDGRGLDPEALKARALDRGIASAEELAAMDDGEARALIFRPGFSTAAQVSEVSGRGVGMDVVRKVVVDQLKGTIDLRSTIGAGTEIVLGLPLTLAIIQVLLARAGGELLAVPLDAVVRTLLCRPSEVSWVHDREVVMVQGKPIPLVRVAEVLGLGGHGDGDELHVILTEHAGEPLGLLVEALVAKREIVIKSLGELLTGVPCASGATLLGDRCAVIVDVPALIARALRRGGGARPNAPTARPAAQPDAPHVLLVEDSEVMAESLRRLLVEAGYRVTVARDGVEGLAMARAASYDLVSTDVMMPRMDGYELTRALRATPAYADVPIVMVTSRSERIDQVRGFDAGVDEYITKPHDRRQLVQAIGRLIAARKGAR